MWSLSLSLSGSEALLGAILTKLTIIGLGLIGGSLGLALKRFGGDRWQVAGYSRRLETTERALSMDAIDVATPTIRQAVAAAEVVVLATPISAIPQVLAEAAPYLSKGCVVTDTASVKAQVAQWARAALPAGVQFVGGHPMAGKETWGLEVAETGLFQGAAYCIVPAEGAEESAIALVRGIAETVGAKPLLLSAEVHDHMVGGISHLPLALSAALVSTTQKDEAWPGMGSLAAGGYRDTTRLAAGNPEMGRDIFLGNGKEVALWIDRLVAELSRLRREIDLADGDAIEAALRRARDGREAWFKQRFRSEG